MAGPGDRRRVETTLGDEAPHDRRRELGGVVVGLGRRRLGCRRRRWGRRRFGREAQRLRCRRRRGWFGDRRGRNGLGSRGGRGRGRSRLGSAARGRCVGHDREAGADLDRLALGHEDLGHVSRGRRGHLGVDLVGRHLEEWLVGVHALADLLQPARDGSLGDRLAELRHRHVHSRHPSSLPRRRSTPLTSFPRDQCSGRPISASAASPNTSLSVGCGCTRAAMSAAFASQFTER